MGNRDRVQHEGTKEHLETSGGNSFDAVVMRGPQGLGVWSTVNTVDDMNPALPIILIRNTP